MPQRSRLCISYLDISGTPSHLRYLIRRLRRKLPHVPILVGLWPTEDEVLKEARVRAIIGADYCSTSLREAVSYCIEAAQKAGDARGSVNSVVEFPVVFDQPQHPESVHEEAGSGAGRPDHIR